MNILITGGAGFIGSHLCDELLGQGHTLVAVDNLVLGREENIAHLFSHSGFTFCKGDILDAAFFEALFVDNRFDVVFHLAANSDIQKGGNDPMVDYELTFRTTFNVLQCMRKYGVAQLVFASTSAIYGETTDLLWENYGPLRPVSNYGAAKLASEAYITAFAASYGIRAWITRFPNVVGERFTHGVIYDFIRKLKNNPHELTVLGNGEQIKPYMYVKDLVRGIMYVWENSHEPVNVYNLGVDSRTKVKDIARMVIEELGLQAHIVYTGGDRGWVGDVPEFKYDLSKIHLLGWQAQHTSDEAVSLAIKKAIEYSK
ncbi:MAG: NAD-dependent epimerase/dehydratase family protein [Prevotellaceae bacterium]|jgi:UDP-glucose 4-epimerase|nr:NAD-dependent epimerase/dehydratase family protein [Prevotellaceae bacterium]